MKRARRRQALHTCQQSSKGLSDHEIVACVALMIILVPGWTCRDLVATRSPRARAYCKSFAFQRSFQGNIFAQRNAQVFPRLLSVLKSSSNDEIEDSKLRDSLFRQRNACWVVLVDDEESIRLSVGDFLYDEGYQVSACADADSCLELLNKRDVAHSNETNATKRQFPDAIISDIRMPGGKDGIELLQLIRESDDVRIQRIPVILLTAKALTADRVLGYQAGADYYLPKPFNPAELLSILDNAILRQKQMAGSMGSLERLQDEMNAIKQIVKRNSALTIRETDVYLTNSERETLELIAAGYSNAEIAQERNISVPVLTRTIQKLYAATKTNTRTALLRWGIQTGYVPPR
jgi:DNA-binding response OmpR family regulator